MIVNVKNEVVDAAGNAIKKVERPENGHPFIPDGTKRSKVPRGAPTPPAYDGEPDATSELAADNESVEKRIKDG
jgi:hypothetical protein